MKTLLLTLTITIIGLAAKPLTAGQGVCKETLTRTCVAGESMCRPVTTVEVCRRNYTKAVCILGQIKQIPFVEVTYKTTGKCGKTVTWKKVYRGQGPATS